MIGADGKYVLLTERRRAQEPAGASSWVRDAAGVKMDGDDTGQISCSQRNLFVNANP
jgi:hypothetical protein